MTDLALVKSIADAVLYEGYILYPYRASAVKNQQRFNFGVLVPRLYSEGQGGSEPSSMRTECLVEGERPAIEVRVRFLQLVSREVFQLTTSQPCAAGEAETQYRRVAALAAGGKTYHTWQEAVEREVVVEEWNLRALVAKPRQVEFAFASGDESETLYDGNGQEVGKIVRRRCAINGVIAIGAQSRSHHLSSVSVEIENMTPLKLDCSLRDEVLMVSLASTHTILGARDGEFVSLLDPPDALVEQAAACKNVGTWPVLVGNEPQCDTMLSSPIILYDYPQIAPESGCDFFDGTEIDEMLALRVMTLTDAEKREMQEVDPRARQILERTESLPPEHWQKLHGAIRGLNTIRQT